MSIRNSLAAAVTGLLLRHGRKAGDKATIMCLPGAASLCVHSVKLCHNYSCWCIWDPVWNSCFNTSPDCYVLDLAFYGLSVFAQ